MANSTRGYSLGEPRSDLTVLERISGAEFVFFMVDELQKSDDFAMIDRLRDENERLQEILNRFRRHWKVLIVLLQEALDAALHLEYEVNDYCREEGS
jgi:hypothetical protein